MSLKKSSGNMYPWVSHTHSHLGGECSHKCVYCYVDNPKFGRDKKYQGKLRLLENEFNVQYGTGKTIFIEHMNDLFAADVPDDFIFKVVSHCLKYPLNTYVFQTKNPARYKKFLDLIPKNSILGTTVETNRDVPDISKAPKPIERIKAMALLPADIKKFITIEPVLDFDVIEFADMIEKVKPFFVNLGADSKGRGLVEPTVTKIMELVKALKDRGIELREKHNLERLMK